MEQNPYTREVYKCEKCGVLVGFTDVRMVVKKCTGCQTTYVRYHDKQNNPQIEKYKIRNINKYQNRL